MSEDSALQRIPGSPRTANFLSVLGIALMAGAILYGFHSLNRIGNEIDTKKAKLTDLAAEIKPLREEVERLRDGPLSDLITPKAIKVLRQGLKDQEERQLSNFIFWLELPYARKADIREVRYLFPDPSRLKNLYTSDEPSNGFMVSYLGWGLEPLVQITVVPKESDEFPVQFRALEELQVVGGGDS